MSSKRHSRRFKPLVRPNAGDVGFNSSENDSAPFRYWTTAVGASMGLKLKFIAFPTQKIRKFVESGLVVANAANLAGRTIVTHVHRCQSCADFLSNSARQTDPRYWRATGR